LPSKTGPVVGLLHTGTGGSRHVRRSVSTTRIKNYNLVRKGQRGNRTANSVNLVAGDDNDRKPHVRFACARPCPLVSTNARPDPAECKKPARYNLS
jgi:hypothetical protein